jgi:transposase InsO family protein
VSWALRKSLSRELAVSALQHALTARRPPPGLVHHTDRGSQYASGEYRQLFARHGAASSMSAAGNCYDNAVAESFFATLKKELVHGCAFETRSEAYDAISDYSRTTTTRSGATRPPETNRPLTSSWPIPVGLRHSHINNLSGISGDLHTMCTG